MGGLSWGPGVSGGGPGAAGKFLRTDTTGAAVQWDGVNTYIPIAMVANAANLPIDDSGVYIFEITGTLTAAGTLTPVLAVPADAFMMVFDNKTTGNFALTVAGFPTLPIPKGKSTWYWDGISALEMIVRENTIVCQTLNLPATLVNTVANAYTKVLCSSLSAAPDVNRGNIADAANSRFVIPVGGDGPYTVHAECAFQAGATKSQHGVAIYLNGASVSVGSYDTAQVNDYACCIDVDILELKAGDIIEMYYLSTQATTALITNDTHLRVSKI